MPLNPYDVLASLYREWEAYNVGTGRFTPESFADAVVGTTAACGQAYYGSTPTYRQGATQFAYLFNTFPTCFTEVAHYLDVAFAAGGALTAALRPDNHATVLAIGAGPGSEGVALADYLDMHVTRRPSTAGMVCVDREEWREGYIALRNHACAAGSACYVKSFFDNLTPDEGIVADVCVQPLPMRLLEYAHQSTLVIGRLILSETLERSDGIAAGLQSLSQQLPSGSTVVLIDRPQSAVAALMSQCAQAMLAVRPSGGRILLCESETSPFHRHCGYACPDWLWGLFRQRRRTPKVFCNTCGVVVELH